MIDLRSLDLVVPQGHVTHLDPLLAFLAERRGDPSTLDAASFARLVGLLDRIPRRY